MSTNNIPTLRSVRSVHPAQRSNSFSNHTQEQTQGQTQAQGPPSNMVKAALTELLNEGDVRSDASRRTSVQNLLMRTEHDLREERREMHRIPEA
ncbi:hypothetical protein ASPZODRAFT_128948 [Penicilliopsis zonata CBS 506.65]|uniref:Uncharacterized protein n=1 Tax=Penicilliopsis zonata CBS 506.65 TaxID=1073090 RepID=A0A1L9ST88_9EURO|nr:hypothetical protein ASPZODRAFT_128948 [Penicilliopsis zonata CBS 506.65]OJJ50331.1 hypothetical protein ASPZODRAFT_128948 [Penicilliopsis zonata CBS 506.65]